LPVLQHGTSVNLDLFLRLAILMSIAPPQEIENYALGPPMQLAAR
jgi:hypothetical protein